MDMGAMPVVEFVQRILQQNGSRPIVAQITGQTCKGPRMSEMFANDPSFDGDVWYEMKASVHW